MTEAKQLDKLPIVDAETGDVLVETPKSSRNKYDYVPGIGGLRLAAALPEGTVFPFDFGFIPSTKADDGDPLDVMVLMDQAVPPGCVVTRLIGAIVAEQRKKNEKWVRSDRLIAVATHAHLHGEIDNMDEINSKALEEIKAFFEHYNKLKQVEFRVQKRIGPKEARGLIKEAASEN